MVVLCPTHLMLLVFLGGIDFFFFFFLVTLSITPLGSEKGTTNPAGTALGKSALQTVKEITSDPLNIL